MARLKSTIGEPDIGRVAAEERKPGWYDDPREPGARRYWTGDEWTAALENAEEARDERARDSVILPSFWIIAGAVGLWFGETYKPSASNQLGLNGNSFYLNPSMDHVVLIASMVVVILGVIRLLVALSDR